MRRSADGVRLNIINNGTLRSHDDRSQTRDTGRGLKDLAERVAGLAGQLTCGLEADDRYRLSVYLPELTSYRILSVARSTDTRPEVAWAIRKDVGG